jgi:SAM-dependent methyltransferase
VQADFATHRLRCPACHRDQTLRLLASESDEREVREGTLRCGACATEFPVHRGVGHLLHNPPEHVVREAAGLERFAEYMKADGWDREKVRQLPNLQDGYWYVQGTSMNQILTTVDLRPGQWLLDVGSNTCWATNQFAVRGLRAIALDISTVEMQGLYTSDYFIEDGTSYFERLLGSMNEMPVASNSLDYVFCCEVLHHNDPDGLRRTFNEAFRVLKPGGKLLVVNETLKTARDPVGVHTEGVEQFEGYEHAHWALRYRWEAIRAGFLTRLLPPRYYWLYANPSLTVAPDTPRLRAVVQRLKFRLGTGAVGKRVTLAWLYHVVGGVQFGMIATKPTRYLRLAGPAGCHPAERILRSTVAAMADARSRRGGASPGSPHDVRPPSEILGD